MALGADAAARGGDALEPDGRDVIAAGLTGLAPRRAALRTLERVRKGETFDGAFERSIGRLPDADRRLAHELAAGVLRGQRLLDARLAPLIPRGWSSVAASIQDVLRLGAYQLTALDRVPAHAAVSTGVALAREVGGDPAGGFVNAVLRQVSVTAGDAAPAPAGDETARLAESLSHPEWLVRRWAERHGLEETRALLERNNTRPELVLQPARASIEELRARWTAAGIDVRSAPFEAGLITDRSRPADLPGFMEGDFVVQDPAQAVVVRYAAFDPDATVYDACAAPGGKTVALGRAGATVLAADVNRRRAKRLAENLQRAGGGGEHVIVADASHPPVRADGVLLDAPCLGTGTFARHPDARWRVTEAALAALAEQQAALLDGAADAVRPGGLLVYATCSLEPEENEWQVDRFLERHPEFERAAGDTVPAALLSPRGDLMLLPQRDGIDGAFAARMRRR